MDPPLGPASQEIKMLVLSLKVIHYQISNVKNGSPLPRCIRFMVSSLFKLECC
jgi:hypothetical protein